MEKNLIPGVIGAVVGAIILYFLLGIPSEVRDLGRSVSKLEGQFETLVALQGQVKTLETRVASVEEGVSLLTGTSKKFGSGWVDFEKPIDLRKGDRLGLKIGGTAQKVLVRLLPAGKSPDLRIGVLPDQFVVPEDRNLFLDLQEDHLHISQISVHGGSSPWDSYFLGPDNGPATLEKVTLPRH